jgi:hypothetical protein
MIAYWCLKKKSIFKKYVVEFLLYTHTPIQACMAVGSPCCETSCLTAFNGREPLSQIAVMSKFIKFKYKQWDKNGLRLLK